MKLSFKIPAPVPAAFRGGHTLIIAAGRQDAVLYEVAEEKVRRLDAFKIPTPHYSDKEGEFRTRGRGTTVRSGGVRELDPQIMVNEFLREFERRVKNLPSDFDRVYVFASKQVKNRLLEVLPLAWRERLASITEGNYYHEEPLELIKKIAQAEARVQKSAPANLEARKILSKSRAG
jgi:hypothetical protein